MKRIILSVISSIFSLSAYTSSADQIINQIDPALNIGIEVVDLTTGENLYQRNADRSFIPASNMKLFSDAVALIALGPDYRFKTQLSTNAPTLDQGVLKGPIYLNFSGDPSLTYQQLSDLLAQLQNWHIQKIQGNVILDSYNSYVSAYPPGWAAKDLKYSYGAPLAPIVLDENRLMVTVNPASRASEPALIEFAHPNAIKLINQVKTNSTSKGCGVDFIMDHDNNLTVRGCVGVGQWAIQQRIAIRNPLLYTEALVKEQLQKLQVQLEGSVILGKAPKDAFLLGTHYSKPLSQLLADTLKPSDNLYADSLFLHAAAKLNGSPLNWDKAQVVVKQFLEKQTGINLQNAILTDGSGLSRQNLLTPKQTVGLLKFLHDRFPLSYEYIAALPVAGRDGTLQRRLKLPSQQGFVRAKTGTMSGIVGLSGYLYTANAHTLAFAIFINRTPHTKSSAVGKSRYLVDALCTFFLKQMPNNQRYAPPANPHARVAFQNQTTPADLNRMKKSKWRAIESNIKLGLKGQAVSILFREDQLILNDKNLDPSLVWNVLRHTRQKFSFTAAVEGKSIPNLQNQTPFLLWVKNDQNNHRVWTIRENLS